MATTTTLAPNQVGRLERSSFAVADEYALLEGGRLETWDIVVIVLYFVTVLGFGIWSSLKNRGSVGGYFLAGRSMHFIPVGASLFASNIGSGHFIGLAGSGAASGIGISVFELNAIFVLMVLGWIFAPVYIAAGVFTMPQYLRKRFGGQRIRVYLSVVALLLSIFTKVAADLYAGATFIEQSLRWDLYSSICLLLAMAALFTIAGGLTAVIWTDFVQTIIMIIGATILMIFSFIEVGGYRSLVNEYFNSMPNSTRFHLNHPEIPYNYTKCGIAPDNAMHLLRPADDGSLPWTGITFGLTISAIWYWCSDQVIVQRVLSAKDLSHAKAGTILAGYLKILPMWLLVFPGMVARILFPNTVGCADPVECKEICGIESGCTNIAYPMLVLELMPTGLRGIMIAVMMAALMSSLTSIFNSSSTIFTMDIWRRIRKQAGEVELLIVGRLFVIFMVVVSIVWIPIVQNFSELFHYIQSITSYLAPPVCAIYVLAVGWKRVNEQGAFWGLMIGLVVGLVRFIWEFVYTVPPCGQEDEDNRPSIIKDVHYLHFGCILFAIVIISAIIISLLTKPIDDKHLPRLTFASRFSDEPRVDIDGGDEDIPKKKPVDGHVNYAADMNETGASTNGSSATGLDVTIVTQPAPEKPMPIWKKIAFWLCGIEKQSEPEISEEERAALEAKQTSLHEKPFWKRICNINAIVLMTVAIFFWAFFY